MADFDIERRLRFAQVTDVTKKNLKEAWKAVAPELPTILDAFYSHLVTEPVTAAILGNHVERLKSLQMGHWERLFSGTFDSQYMKGVYTVGMVHQRIGLEPRWFIAGYRLVLSRIVGVLVRQNRKGKDRLSEVLDAVTTAMMLDMDLAISAYQDAIEDEKRRTTTAVMETFGKALEELERGSLSHAIEGDVPEAFLAMRDNLHNAVKRLRETIVVVLEGATQVQVSAQEIAQAATDLSSRTIEEAASLEESSAQSMEITRMVKRTAASASEAAQLATTVRLEAQKGEDSIEQAAKVMVQIVEASNRISEIVGVIDNISEQTNLLSLNAAIEAAHAGQAGKGFEVVASAVRKLAAQARESAKKIDVLVKDAIAITSNGAKLVRESGANFKQVALQVASIEALVVTISQSAHEQALGVEQISAAVGELSTVTNGNAAMVQQAMASARSLEELSQKQTKVLSFFTV